MTRRFKGKACSAGARVPPARKPRAQQGPHCCSPLPPAMSSRSFLHRTAHHGLGPPDPSGQATAPPPQGRCHVGGVQGAWQSASTRLSVPSAEWGRHLPPGPPSLCLCPSLCLSVPTCTGVGREGADAEGSSLAHNGQVRIPAPASGFADLSFFALPPPPPTLLSMGAPRARVDPCPSQERPCEGELGLESWLRTAV